MSLADTLRGSSSSRKRTVNVVEVRINPLNFYPMSEDLINSLAYSINQFGVLSNLVVYEDDLSDGKKYTIVGGETRFRAICKLVEEEKHDGFIDITVVPKPANQQEEIELIREDNKQREKTKEVRLAELASASRTYEYLKSINQTPPGKRRDFIGLLVGISGRYVDILEDEINSRTESSNGVQSDDSSESSNSTSTTRQKTEQDVLKKIRQISKQLDKAIELAIEVGSSTAIGKLEDVRDYYNRELSEYL